MTFDSRDLRFGAVALRLGLIDGRQLAAALTAQAGGGGRRIGEALVAAGALGPDDVQRVLAEQGLRVARCGGCGARYNVSTADRSLPPCPACEAASMETLRLGDPRIGVAGDAGIVNLAGAAGASDDTRRPPRSIHDAVRERCATDAEVSLDPSAAEAGAAGPGAPRRLGRYTVTGQLGAGGMGQVLRVKDANLNRQVAAKVLPGHPRVAVLQRFLREAQVTGQLEHPNIVPIHELGVAADGTVFFTMKRVAGQDLADVLAAAHSDPERHSLGELLGVFGKVCDAVAFAHAKGVIHRDLKPANIMVGPYGEVLVMDWGLAKVLGTDDPLADAVAPELDLGATGDALAGAAADALVTRDGAIMGTPVYMPPEQAKGEIARLDARSDVYSLGAILYQLLTLEKPFEGPIGLLLLQVVAGELVPPSLRTARPVPWELEAVVLKAMAVEPDDRYPDVGALKADVERYLSGHALSAARYRRSQLALKWVARHKATSAVAGLLLALLLGASGWRVWRGAAERRAFAALGAQAARHAASRDWGKALAAAELALELRADPTLGALAARCQDEIGALAAFREVAQRLAPVAHRIEETRPFFYTPQFDIVARLKTLSADLDRLAPLTRTPAGQASARLFKLLGMGRYFTGQAAAAEAALARAHTLAPADAVVGLYLGRIYLERAMTRLVAARVEADARRAGHLALGRELTTRALAALGSGDAASLGTRPLDRYLAAAYRLAAEGKTDDLRAHCRAGLERFAGQIGAEELLTLLARWAATPAESLALLDRALAIRPHYAWAYFLRGSAHYHAGQREKAVADYDAVLRIDPRHVLALHNRGHALMSLGRPAKAVADLDRALAIDPALNLLWRTRASARSAAGDHAGALADLDQALERGGAPGPIQLVRSRVLRLLSNHEAADQALDRSIAAGSLDALETRIRARIEADRLDGLLADIDRLIAARPDDGGPRVQRGMVLARQGQPDAALAAFAHAARLEPTSAFPHLQAALTLRDLGRQAEALAAIGRAIATAPDEARLFRIRGTIQRRLSRLDAARADLDRAVALAPRMGHNYLQRGLLLASQGQLKAALADLDRAVALAPRDAQCLLHRARARARSGQLDAALEDLTRAADLAPDEREVCIERARLLVQMGRRPAAYEAFGRYLARFPGDAEVLYERGATRARAGDRTGALADAEAAIRAAPDRARGYNLRGVLRKRVDPRGALADLTKAIALEPRDARAYLNRAGLLARLGRADAALADCDRAIALRPGHGPAHEERARVQFKRGKHAAAAADADRAIGLGARTTFLYWVRGIAHQQAGRLDAALADYDRSIALDANHASAYANRALVHRAQGRLKAALKDASRELELRPGHARAWRNRAILKSELGDHAGAVRDLDQALHLEPKHLTTLARRAETKLAAGDVAGAEADVRDALRAGRVPPRVLLARAALRRHAGDVKGARADLDRVIAAAPRLARAWEARARLRQDTGDRPGALTDYDRALALTDSPGLRLERAQLRHQLGDTAAALVDCEAALKAAPRLARAYLIRGECRRKADPEKALGDFGKALSLDATLFRAHVRVAQVYLGRKDLQRALVEVERARVLAPDDWYVRLNRALILQALKRHTEAAADARVALKTAPPEHRAAAQGVLDRALRAARQR